MNGSLQLLNVVTVSHAAESCRSCTVWHLKFFFTTSIFTLTTKLYACFPPIKDSILLFTSSWKKARMNGIKNSGKKCQDLKEDTQRSTDHREKKKERDSPVFSLESCSYAYQSQPRKSASILLLNEMSHPYTFQLIKTWLNKGYLESLQHPNSFFYFSCSSLMSMSEPISIFLLIYYLWLVLFYCESFPPPQDFIVHWNLTIVF